MSRTRSSSMPPDGNPFWSQKAWDEWKITWSRPSTLPVPAWSEAEGEEPRPLGGHRGGGDLLGDLGTHQGGGDLLGDKFRTPQSWDSEQGRGISAKGLRSEGELPPEVVRKGRVDDQKLEKELETTMFEQVMEDNRKLREELMRLQRAQTGQQQRDRGSGGERRPSGEREREPHRQGRLLDPHHHRHHHGDSYDSLRTARGSQCLQKQSIRASRMRVWNCHHGLLRWMNRWTSSIGELDGRSRSPIRVEVEGGKSLHRRKHEWHGLREKSMHCEA